MDTMRQAYIIRTSRDKPLVYPVITQVALLGDAFFVVKGDGIVGAYIDADLPSGTWLLPDRPGHRAGHRSGGKD